MSDPCPEGRDHPLLDVPEVAFLFGVTERWIYRHLHELPHVKVGRFVRFRPAEVEAYLQRQARGGGAS